MAPERVTRHDDEGLYQPRIHSRWIRRLHQISVETGQPMTVVLDMVLREHVADYEAGPSGSGESRASAAGKGVGERLPLHKTYEIAAWTYEADVHCGACAERRFGAGMEDRELVDGEGNPVAPLFLESVTADDHCGDCGASLLESL